MEATSILTAVFEFLDGKLGILSHIIVKYGVCDEHSSQLVAIPLV
jgi:hypothetical protein